MKRKDTPARMTPEEARRTAVALTYDASSSAPRVVAKGRGLIAQAIVERAKAAGVYVHESPELVALLMQVELDDAIPPQLAARGVDHEGAEREARAHDRG